MPVSYPHYDHESDGLVDHLYYTTEEVGALLHLHANTVRQRIRDGKWDAIRPGRYFYMDAAQIGAAVESMRTRGDLDGFEPDPPALGRALSDPDTESLQ